jgi:nucleotide-binding universal stress UspA family protein
VLLGSVSKGVLHAAKVPVTIVKHTGANAAK